MADFTAITTQEQFDNAIADRLKRQEEKLTKDFTEKYSDYSDLKSKADNAQKAEDSLKAKLEETTAKLKESNKTIEDLKVKVKGYESDSVKTRLALDNGLTVDAKEFIKGETEEEMLESIHKLQGVLKAQNTAPPLGGAEGQPSTDPDDLKRQDIRAMIRTMKGK